MVIDGEPSYHLLLCQHWMHTCDLVGHYRSGTYTYIDDKGNTCPMYHSGSKKSIAKAARLIRYTPRRGGVAEAPYTLNGRSRNHYEMHVTLVSQYQVPKEG